MPEPLRSPKQSRIAAKNRSHPYARPASNHRARDAGLTRSTSILGSIKSFVTAPFSWLSLGDSQEASDSPQKRRVSNSERGGSPPRAKRARRESPEVGGYLDPPTSIFPAAKPPIPAWNHVNGIRLTRSMSVDPLRPFVEPADMPLPPSRGNSILSRTSMSVEPLGPSGLRRSTTRDLSMPPPSPFARSYARSSLTPQPSGATFGPSPKRRPRESTAPPLLSSPAPSFTRPPLSTPVPVSRTLSREMSEGPISSLLGRNRQSMSPLQEIPTRSLLVLDENAPTRESLSFKYIPQIAHVNSGSPSKTSAERTLSALESFRTPLHVSRFPTAPPTERPRKVHVPMPSKLGFDHTPEGRKEKAKRGPTVVGPYSTGMSGMRKLLARRREEIKLDVEAEFHADLEQSNVSEVDKNNVDQEEGKTKEDEMEEAEPRKTRPQSNGFAFKADSQLPRTRSPPRPKPDGPYSILRAQSSRVSRTHAPAPRLKKAKNTFSLDEDDDAEWSMSVEDVKNYQAQATQAQPTISFSVTRRMSETGIQTDIDNESLPRAKSPPLPSQPQTFGSLLSRIGPPASIPSKAAAMFPESAPQSNTDAQSQPAETASTSSAPATLPFSLGAMASIPKPVDVGTSLFVSNTTTPAPSPTPAPPSSTSGIGGVPAFFANTKTQFTPPKMPLGSLFGGLPSEVEKSDSAGQPNVFGGFGTGKEEKSDKKELQKEAKPSPFGEVNKPSVFGGSSTSAFGNTMNSTTTSATSQFSGFGSTTSSGPGEGSKNAFSFGAPTGNETIAPNPGINILGVASKPDISSTEASSKRAFSFPAAPSPSISSTAAPIAISELPSSSSSKRAFSFDARPQTSASSAEAPKSQFSFGTSTSTQPHNATTETPKTPFSFGAAPSTPPPADKKTSFGFGNASGMGASRFSFGSNSLSTGSAVGTTAEAPKPAFVGFEINTPATPITHKPESSSAESGDGMEVNGDRMEESPTRSVDKKDAPASQIAQSSPFAGFGATSSGSSTGGFFGQDKPSTGSFSFSQPKPSTGSGFGFGQSAEKSTTASTGSAFGFGQSTEKSAAGVTTNTGFSFGQSANKPTTSIGTGFGFGNDTSKPAVQSQLSFGAPLNSPFGSSTSNATTSPSFAFGQPNPNTNPNPNPFGQSQQPENGTSTAPSSPSLFSQQVPQPSQPQSPSFAFNVPSSNPFSSNTGATQSPSTTSTPAPFQFGTQGATPQQPQQPGAGGGSTMFTLGGAATPPRRVKGLPTRRAKRP